MSDLQKVVDETRILEIIKHRQDLNVHFFHHNGRSFSVTVLDGIVENKVNVFKVDVTNNQTIEPLYYEINEIDLATYSNQDLTCFNMFKFDVEKEESDMHKLLMDASYPFKPVLVASTHPERVDGIIKMTAWNEIFYPDDFFFDRDVRVMVDPSYNTTVASQALAGMQLVDIGDMIENRYPENLKDIFTKTDRINFDEIYTMFHNSAIEAILVNGYFLHKIKGEPRYGIFKAFGPELLSCLGFADVADTYHAIGARDIEPDDIYRRDDILVLIKRPLLDENGDPEFYREVHKFSDWQDLLSHDEKNMTNEEIDLLESTESF